MHKSRSEQCDLKNFRKEFDFSKHKTKNERIKLGFVSQHFTYNAVGEWFQGFPQYIDRTRFVVYCYNGASNIDTTKDVMYNRIKAQCDFMKDVSLNPADAAAVIRGDEIDMLIDLGLFGG
jgi:predicted O-linked N-acetylglucosamine transferase (SPINDLY family)